MLYNSAAGRFDGNFTYDPRTSATFQALTAAASPYVGQCVQSASISNGVT